MARWMTILLAFLLPAWAAAGDNHATGAGTGLKVAVVSAAAKPGHNAATARRSDAGIEREIGAYKAKYEVLYGGFKVGEMTQRLSAMQNGRKQLETVAYTTGLASWLKSDKVVEQSIWSDKSGDALPLSYTYRYNGQSKRVFEKLGFDWQAGTVSSLRDGKTVQLPAETGTLDKHMYQIVLREDLLKGEKVGSYRVADRNKIKEYKLELLGKEVVNLEGFGDLHCVKLKKGTTLFWLAEKFDYLPVKIEKEEGGSTASSHLIGYNPG